MLLLLTLHHIISDGWSMGIFFKELSHLYNAYASGKEPTLSPLALQYADFSLWQRNWLQGDVLEQQLSYWKNSSLISLIFLIYLRINQDLKNSPIRELLFTPPFSQEIKDKLNSSLKRISLLSL
jgi:hypothetical protein